MNIYYFSGFYPVGLRDSVITSDSMIVFHGDGRFIAEITAPTLRNALFLLRSLIGECEYTINPRYSVVNDCGRRSYRILKNKNVK